ncbi:hypothetical protein [Leyella stercorea]|uniref:hypothetical protein n=1 Tax=Leyella stercorea TaxID=363265 RepID=UPI00266ECBC2|nr:hypothetical protein [Leyella stercorea]
MVTNNVTAEFVIRVDRRRCPHRPAQMSAPTDADVRIDRRRCPYRPTQMSASVDADQNNATITMFPQRDC